MGVSYALYDEGAFRNELEGWDSANMQIAPESIRAVNNVLPQDRQITKVELGKYYGSKNNNTLRVIFNEPVLHPFNHIILKLLRISLTISRLCLAHQTLSTQIIKFGIGKKFYTYKYDFSSHNVDTYF